MSRQETHLNLDEQLIENVPSMWRTRPRTEVVEREVVLKPGNEKRIVKFHFDIEESVFDGTAWQTILDSRSRTEQCLVHLGRPSGNRRYPPISAGRLLDIGLGWPKAALYSEWEQVPTGTSAQGGAPAVQGGASGNGMKRSNSWDQQTLGGMLQTMVQGAYSYIPGQTNLDESAPNAVFDAPRQPTLSLDGYGYDDDNAVYASQYDDPGVDYQELDQGIVQRATATNDTYRGAHNDGHGSHGSHGNRGNHGGHGGHGGRGRGGGRSRGVDGNEAGVAFCAVRVTLETIATMLLELDTQQQRKQAEHSALSSRDPTLESFALATETEALRFFHALVDAESEATRACPAVNKLLWGLIERIGARFAARRADETAKVLRAMLAEPGRIPCMVRVRKGVDIYLPCSLPLCFTRLSLRLQYPGCYWSTEIGLFNAPCTCTDVCLFSPSSPPSPPPSLPLPSSFPPPLHPVSPGLPIPPHEQPHGAVRGPIPHDILRPTPPTPPPLQRTSHDTAHTVPGENNIRYSCICLHSV